MSQNTLPLLNSLRTLWQTFQAFATAGFSLALVLVPVVLIANEQWKRKVL